MTAEQQATPKVPGKELVLVVGLLIWLSGYWWWSDATSHRLSLFVLVLPGVIANRDLLRGLFQDWWLRLVLLLLAYQWLSRFWSDGSNEAHGYWLDVIFMVVLLLAFLLVAAQPCLMRVLLPGLAMGAGVAGLGSLVFFYADPSHSLADARLRNPLVYEGGLNPVLTGLLSSFGGLVAVWLTMRRDGRRWVWLTILVVLVLTILATQSRGPMLAFGIGFAVLAAWSGKKIRPALVVCALSAVAYFGMLAWVQSGEAATRDLLGRGATGRLEIYAWYFRHLTGLEALVGKGMGSTSSISEDEFGWLVHHPHSIYVAQYYLAGALGMGLMLLVLGMGLLAAVKLGKGSEPLWMALLLGFGVGLAFDGSVVFSVFSTGRIEPLLLVFPAAMAVRRSGGFDGMGRRAD